MNLRVEVHIRVSRTSSLTQFFLCQFARFYAQADYLLRRRRIGRAGDLLSRPGGKIVGRPNSTNRSGALMSTSRTPQTDPRACGAFQAKNRVTIITVITVSAAMTMSFFFMPSQYRQVFQSCPGMCTGLILLPCENR